MTEQSPFHSSNDRESAPADLRDRFLALEHPSDAEVPASYRAELAALIHPPFRWRAALPSAVLLALLLGCIGLIVRNLIAVEVSASLRLQWTVLAGAFISAAWVIARDLWRRQHSRNGELTVANTLALAAAVVTVLVLLGGLNSGQTASATHSGLLVFVFYFACTMWSLDTRLKDRELAMREQLLLLEAKLAHIANLLDAQRPSHGSSGG